MSFALFVLVAAALPADPPPAAKSRRDDPNALVCRRPPVTGSLVQGRRICRTRAQLRAESEAARASAETAQDHGAITSCAAQVLGGC
ncbi:hypothetical protein [Sphingomonas sp.]|jgi:hypothetical protein|uniref:hypothetical protein n=1 Tax=Sphingomonas sp. TaxID=28214 RepID=UPI002D7EEE7D|nr:hypothetical protein [Sphingomonas sp.]HEU0043067.1 hypothetical protein [Sphingomonas sp.]